MKIGLIVGDGDLPRAVISGAKSAGYDVYVASLKGQSDQKYPDVEQDWFAFGEFGKVTKAFKNAGVTHVCFAGHVKRPDFKTLRPDFKTITHLPGALNAARKGDDALLAFVLKTFEDSGFKIIAPQELCETLLLPEGNLGKVAFSLEYRDDAQKAIQIASEIGRMDIGQGVVVCRGLVLAVEAQEGTDAMLRRVAQLPEAIRGTEVNRAGVLAKVIKPGQETRVDLPTIGPETVRLAAQAGLAGIIAESSGAFILRRDEAALLADEAGMFITGLPQA